MKTSSLPTVIPVLLAVLGAVLIGLWLSVGYAPGDIGVRAPGADDTPAPQAGEKGARAVAGQPVKGPGQPADIPGAWPGFRGPRRDAIGDDATKLARSWPASGPPVLWQIELGEGYASAAIANGCVFVLDYDEKAEADTMRCLSLADGRELWRNSYPAEVARNHGMSRTTPAIAGDAVISVGPRCHVACWDMATGKNRWLLDLVADYGAVERQWYAGQCPLVDGSKVILAPGGPQWLLVAIDCLTGREVWKTPNPRRWLMTHSSIMPMEFAGRRMYVYCGNGGTAGVSADDGTLLWDETQWVENFATAPSPLPLPDGRIFLCSGYDATGAMMLQLKDQGGRLSAETAFTMKRKEFNAEQQTPIYYKGHLYGVRKSSGQLVCLDLNGKERWNSGSQKFEHGPYLIADGLIINLSGDGLLAITEATPDAYRPLAKHPVLDKATDAWGPMALVAGRLIVRDITRMACVDVRGK